MKVNVQTLYFFKELFGGKTSISLDVEEEISVYDLIILMDSIYDSGIKDVILKDSNSTKNRIAIFVNGSNIFATSGLDTILKDKDVVLIFPPVGGG